MADSPQIIPRACTTRGQKKSIGRFGWWIALLLICLAVAACMINLLRPRMTSRPPNPRAICANHLHQIGLGIALYQNDHGGHYPESLVDLVVGGHVRTYALICFESNDMPADLDGATTREAAAIMMTPGHSSYVYLGHGDWTEAATPRDAIVAYDPLANHDGAGSVVLLGDGHAEWIGQPRAARLIKAASATTRPVSAATVP